MTGYVRPVAATPYTRGSTPKNGDAAHTEQGYPVHAGIGHQMEMRNMPNRYTIVSDSANTKLATINAETTDEDGDESSSILASLNPGETASVTLPDGAELELVESDLPN